MAVKMTVSHIVKTSVIVLIGGVFLALLGWFVYPVLLFMATAGTQTSIVATSIGQPLVHRLLTAFAFMVTGIIIGISVLFYRRSTPEQNLWVPIALSLSVAAVAITVGMLFLNQTISAAIEGPFHNFQIEPAFPLDRLPIHHIVMIANIFVGLCTVSIAIFSHSFARGKRRQ